MKLLKLISPSDEELLRQVKVASPCHEAWEEMPGGDTVRSCDRCQQKVYNLSEMTAAEAAKLVRETEGRLCIRYYRRADGTMLTKDCPVGATAKRRKRVKIVAALSGATAAAAGAAFKLSHPVAIMGGAPPVPEATPAPRTEPEQSPSMAMCLDLPPRLAAPKDQVSPVMGARAALPVSKHAREGWVAGTR